MEEKERDGGSESSRASVLRVVGRDPSTIPHAHLHGSIEEHPPVGPRG